MDRTNVGERPASASDARTDALNIAGAFFPRKVAGELRRSSGWRVLAEEYPVTYPQVGPLSERQSSAMDVWAAIFGKFVGPLGIPVILCQIECKKADPGFTDWVFFRKHGGGLRFRHLNFIRQGDAAQAGGLLVMDGNLHTLFDDGRELKGDYRGADRTKSTSSRIQEAARQAALATLSTAMSLRSRAQPPLDRFNLFHLVPLVVTTANLAVCEFNLEDVEQETGRLPKAAEFRPAEFVVYDYPLTGGLALPPEATVSQDIPADNVEALVKMHVLIVNAGKGLDALIDRAEPLNAVLGLVGL